MAQVLFLSPHNNFKIDTKMKKLVLMIAMVVGTTAFAQERKMEKRAISSEDRVEKLTKELDLTEEQQEQIKVLYEKKREARQKEKAERMEIKRIKSQEFDDELKSILTPEQAEKLEAKREKMKMEREKMIEERGEEKLKKSK